MAVKKMMVGIVAAALAATALVATPAHAQEPGDPVGCIPAVPDPSAPPQTVVTVDGLDVTIDPNGDVDTDSLDSYLIGLAFTPVSYALCVAGDFADPVLCVYGIVLGGVVDTVNNPGTYVTRYIERDPDSGQIMIHGNDLAADATGCV